MTVFQGRGPFALPEPRDGHSEYDRRTAETIGGISVVREGPEEFNGYSRPMLFVVPRPEFMVYGDKSLIEPVLQGKRRGGVPDPELLALTATRRPIAHFALKLDYDEEFLRYTVPFPTDWYTERDEPTFWVARLNVDEETGHAHLVLRMRFTNGEHGPELMTKGARAAIGELVTDPKLKNLAFLKRIVKQISFEQEGIDLVARLDLGERGKLIGDLAVANLLPMLMFSAQNVVEDRVIVMHAADGEEVILEAEEEEEAVEESEWVEEKVETEKAEGKKKEKKGKKERRAP